MANAISPIIRQVSSPYLSLQEFKNAPTALDYGNLVAGGNQAAQDAELSNAITRASSWIDQYCNQIIGATLDTEQQRVRISSDGTIKFHPKYFPIVALTSFSWGADPQTLVAAPDCSIAWLEEQQVIFPYANAATNWSSQGPLSLGFVSTPRQPVYINYSYVNGYANTLTASSTNAGGTSITVANATGIIPGDSLKIYDGASTENIMVASTYTYGSTTVPLTSPLLYAHASGISVSALPAAVKEAAILVTSAYLKIRGDASLTMGTTSAPNGTQIGDSQRVGTDIAHAEDLLKPFRRIR
jgi:hypothetical protein